MPLTSFLFFKSNDLLIIEEHLPFLFTDKLSLSRKHLFQGEIDFMILEHIWRGMRIEYE